MGILSSMFAAVSGLNATGSSISIIGDNIANTNTIGYKSARPEFVDVLSGNLTGGGSAGQIGAGSRLSGISQTFTQGSFESTDVTTDMGVDGRGFFIVQDTTGVFYTRAGMFRLDGDLPWNGMMQDLPHALHPLNHVLTDEQLTSGTNVDGLGGLG